MNDDLQTHDLLTRAVGQEPPFLADVASVVSRGTGLRHRRRVARGSALAVGTCAVLGAAFVIVPSLGTASGGQPTTAVAPGAGGPSATTPESSPAPVGRTSTGPTPVTLTGVDAAIAAAIRASSPSNFTLVLPAGDAASGGIDGTADDGSGKGRITVGLSSSTQQVHPCSDPEFKAGASCTERVLADGAVLSLRGLSVADDGVAAYQVVLTYPDGSGVNAEAGNYTIGPSPKVITADEKRHLVNVERSAPTYSLAQLQAVVLAVNAATH